MESKHTGTSLECVSILGIFIAAIFLLSGCPQDRRLVFLDGEKETKKLKLIVSGTDIRFAIVGSSSFTEGNPPEYVPYIEISLIAPQIHEYLSIDGGRIKIFFDTILLSGPHTLEVCNDSTKGIVRVYAGFNGAPFKSVIKRDPKGKGKVGRLRIILDSVFTYKGKLLEIDTILAIEKKSRYYAIE